MDMKELLKSVDALADIEFSRAMEIYPAFHSDHEGVAVVEEEIWETKKEIDGLDVWFGEIKRLCFVDDYEPAVIENAIKRCRFATAEMIQVLAMLVKYKYSHEVRNATSEKE